MIIMGTLGRTGLAHVFFGSIAEHVVRHIRCGAHRAVHGMKVAVLGSGMVGQTISAKLVALGHDVMLGTRDVAKLMARSERSRALNLTFAEWKAQHPKLAIGSFSQAAAHGELVFNCTSGDGAIEALRLAGKANLKDKILIDVGRKSSRAFEGHASDTHRTQHRLTRRADTTGISQCQGRQGAQHDERLYHGRARPARQR